MADEGFEVSINEYVKYFAIGLAVVLTGALVYKFHPRSTFAADGLSPRWDATVEQSQAAHMPALVLFTADWCPACQALHGDALSRPEIADEINSHYVMVTVDLTSRTPGPAYEHSQKYGINAIPTLIRFDAEGKETGRAHYMSHEAMLDWLREGEPGK